MLNHSNSPTADQQQTQIFCVELQGLLVGIELGIELAAGRIRRRIASRGAGDLATNQKRLRAAMLERRRVIDLLTTMGHGYPCFSHRSTSEPDTDATPRTTLGSAVTTGAVLEP